MKKIALIMIAMVWISFSYAQTEISAKPASEGQKVEVNSFKDQAPDMVGKTVEMSGMVTHVCKHGGQKMFIMNDNPDVQVKITTGEKMAAFPAELEGSTVWVKGVVEEMEEEVSEEEAAEKNQDEAHQNIYHVKQYSVACVEYKVTSK